MARASAADGIGWPAAAANKGTALIAAVASRSPSAGAGARTAASACGTTCAPLDGPHNPNPFGITTRICPPYWSESSIQR